MQPTFQGALVDMDGTLYRGETAIEGAAAAIETLRDAGVAVQFLTNNATKSPTEYVDTLAAMGIDADAEDVVTAGVVTADYLAREHATDQIFVVGEVGFRAVLEEAGVTVTDDYRAADVVVLSLDTALDYDLFVRVLRALDPETPLVATNPDRTKPGTDGIVPSAGLVIGAVEGMTGRSPDVIAGKPSALCAEFALERLGVDAADCLLVGDRLDTDIQMGSSMGLTTVLVRTGVTDEAGVEQATITPDYVVDSIADIETVLRARE